MSYISKLIVCMVAIASLVAAMNWLVDPYGLYWSPELEGINTHKVASSERGRTTKPYRVTQVQPQVLIIGNSRVEMGFDDDDPVFNNKRLYNYASPGIGVDTQLARAYSQIMTNPELQHIYISVDFLDFLSTAPDTENAALGVIPDDVNLLNFLFSLDTTLDSVKTLFLQNSQANVINRFGTHHPGKYLSITAHEGLSALFHQKLTEISRRLSSPALSVGTAWRENGNLRQLSEIIKLTKDRNITVTVFINPYHFSYLHTIADHGYFDQFTQWKTMLAVFATDNKITITDFSGFNRYTLETVDIQDKNHTRLNWFWEPAHYTMALGSVMLKDLQASAQQRKAGRQLSSGSISAVIAEDKALLRQTTPMWQQLKHNLVLE